MFDYTQKVNPNQTVLTKAQFDKMVKNHKERPYDSKLKPVVKFFDPIGAGVWLLSDLDPENGIAFGLCDLGMGFPEIGDVSLDEMIGIQHSRRRPLPLGIERDLHFSHNDHNLEEWKGIAENRGNLCGV